jgi:hypothetical protein
MLDASQHIENRKEAGIHDHNAVDTNYLRHPLYYENPIKVSQSCYNLCNPSLVLLHNHQWTS